jgi:hypothetical protein
MKHTILLLLLFFISCSSWKGNLVTEGSYNQAIENSIIDFLNTSSLSKKENVFTLKINDESSDIISVSIFGNKNKIYPSPDIQIGKVTNKIPTRYIEKNGKLFYWYESKAILTMDLVKKLSAYKIIDSTNVKEVIVLPEYSVDDSKKAVDYYFCKNNLLKYKKVTTSITMGYYDMPKLECDR